MLGGAGKGRDKRSSKGIFLGLPDFNNIDGFVGIFA